MLWLIRLLLSLFRQRPTREEDPARLYPLAGFRILIFRGKPGCSLPYHFAQELMTVLHRLGAECRFFHRNEWESMTDCQRRHEVRSPHTMILLIRDFEWDGDFYRGKRLGVVSVSIFNQRGERIDNYSEGRQRATRADHALCLAQRMEGLASELRVILPLRAARLELEESLIAGR